MCIYTEKSFMFSPSVFLKHLKLISEHFGLSSKHDTEPRIQFSIIDEYSYISILLSLLLLP